MKISFDLYKVFYVVGKELNFSKAASKLYISQSAVSQSIRHLEEQLGMALFNRTTKQVSLTPDGEALMAHIEPAVNMILSGEQLMQESKTLKRGQLHIAASDTICRYYLLDFFNRYHHAYPGVEIKVTNRTSVQCVELLHQGNVDFVVTNLPNDHISKDMIVKKTHAFRDVFVANSTRLNRQQIYNLRQLAEEPILMLTKQTSTSEFLYHLFDTQDISITPSVELGSIDLLVDMAKIDLGIAFVPEFCITPEDNLIIVNTAENIPTRHIGLVTHRNRPLSTAAERFATMLLNTDATLKSV